MFFKLIWTAIFDMILYCNNKHINVVHSNLKIQTEPKCRQQLECFTKSLCWY